MQKTGIEYLTHTWNPIAMRCTHVSSGCDHCWHLRMTNRLACNRHFSAREREAYRGGDPYLISGRLSEPMRLRKSAVIGVQFMGDLFHEKVTNEQIAAVFGVMAACPQHTFIVLTKRPRRALHWFEWLRQVSLYSATSPGVECAFSLLTIAEPGMDGPIHCKYGPEPDAQFPLSNVWIGVSIEDQKTADERIPLLLQIPAAKRFVSAEPLLGSVDLRNLPFGKFGNRILDSLTAGTGSETPWNLDLVICGAETGPGKRPMNIDWARSLRDQCAAASVPLFFKKDSDGNHDLDGRVHEEMP